MVRRAIAALAVVVAVPAACSTTSPMDDDDEKVQVPEAGPIDAGAEEAAPTLITCAGAGSVCMGKIRATCADAGSEPVKEDCGAQNKLCDPELGCVLCQPYDDVSCENQRGRMCAPDGQSIVEFDCDPIQGMVCDPDGCHGECAPAALEKTYLGCEYWPTVTSNAVISKAFDFAVAVANASDEVAHLSISRGAKLVQESSVDPGGLVILPLPWIPDLKGPDVINGSAARDKNVRSNDGAYRLRSDRKVAVYQFNALQYKSPPLDDVPGCTTGCYSFSNDASLLLPTSALGTSYVVTGYQTLHAPAGPSGGVEMKMGDFIAITATRDATEVSIETSTPMVGGAGIGPLSVGKSAKVTLDAGDVLELFSQGISSQNSFSGTRVESSEGKPIQIISGVPCTYIPSEISACDHIEETVLPLASFGREHIVAVPTTPSGKRIHTVWIQTAEPQTTLHFDPPDIQPEITFGVPQRFRVGPIDRDFRVWSTKPFGVTQYMHGQGIDDGNPLNAGAGDPSQSVVVPNEQFRTSYTFLAPKDYDQSYVNIVAKIGEPVEVDGKQVPASELEPVGVTGFGVARHALDQSEVHVAKSSQPFGIVVYGYGMYTSYMYPGGLDLRAIPIVR